MIRIDYSDKGDLYVRMKGHAGAEKNAEGHDLVCASASMLIYALVESSRGVGCEYSLDSGNAWIRIRPGRDNLEKARAKVELVVDGFKLLQSQYPQCISLRDHATYNGE